MTTHTRMSVHHVTTVVHHTTYKHTMVHHLHTLDGAPPVHAKMVHHHHTRKIVHHVTMMVRHLQTHHGAPLTHAALPIHQAKSAVQFLHGDLDNSICYNSIGRTRVSHSRSSNAVRHTSPPEPSFDLPEHWLTLEQMARLGIGKDAVKTGHEWPRPVSDSLHSHLMGAFFHTLAVFDTISKQSPHPDGGFLPHPDVQHVVEQLRLFTGVSQLAGDQNEMLPLTVHLTSLKSALYWTMLHNVAVVSFDGVPCI